MIGVVTPEVPLPSPIISAFAMAQIDDYARRIRGCQFAYSYPCQIHELADLTTEIMAELRSKYEHATAFICVHGADGQFFVLAMRKHPVKETPSTTTAGAGAGSASTSPDTDIHDITLTSIHLIGQELSDTNTTLLAHLPRQLKLTSTLTKYQASGTESDIPEAFYPLLCILACNRLLQQWSVDPNALIPLVLDIDSHRQTLNNHITTTVSRCIETTQSQYYWVGDKTLLPSASPTCCPLPNHARTRALLQRLSQYPIWPDEHPDLWQSLTHFAQSKTPKTGTTLRAHITRCLTTTLTTIAIRRAQNIHHFMLRYTASGEWMRHIGSGLEPKRSLLITFFRQAGKAVPKFSELCQTIRQLLRDGDNGHEAVVKLFDYARQSGIDLFSVIKAGLSENRLAAKCEVTALTHDDERLTSHINILMAKLETLRSLYAHKDTDHHVRYILAVIDDAMAAHNLAHPLNKQYTQLACALQQIGVNPKRMVQTGLVREASQRLSPPPRNTSAISISPTPDDGGDHLSVVSEDSRDDRHSTYLTEPWPAQLRPLPHIVRLLGLDVLHFDLSQVESIYIKVVLAIANGDLEQPLGENAALKEHVIRPVIMDGIIQYLLHHPTDMAKLVPYPEETWQILVRLLGQKGRAHEYSETVLQLKERLDQYQRHNRPCWASTLPETQRSALTTHLTPVTQQLISDIGTAYLHALSKPANDWSTLNESTLGRFAQWDEDGITPQRTWQQSGSDDCLLNAIREAAETARNATLLTVFDAAISTTLAEAEINLDDDPTAPAPTPATTSNAGAGTGMELPTLASATRPDPALLRVGHRVVINWHLPYAAACQPLLGALAQQQQTHAQFHDTLLQAIQIACTEYAREQGFFDSPLNVEACFSVIAHMAAGLLSFDETAEATPDPLTFFQPALEAADDITLITVLNHLLEKQHTLATQRQYALLEQAIVAIQRSGHLPTGIELITMAPGEKTCLSWLTSCRHSAEGTLPPLLQIKCPRTHWCFAPKPKARHGEFTPHIVSNTPSTIATLADAGVGAGTTGPTSAPKKPISPAEKVYRQALMALRRLWQAAYDLQEAMTSLRMLTNDPPKETWFDCCSTPFAKKLTAHEEKIATQKDWIATLREEIVWPKVREYHDLVSRLAKMQLETETRFEFTLQLLALTEAWISDPFNNGNSLQLKLKKAVPFEQRNDLKTLLAAAALPPTRDLVSAGGLHPN